MPVPAFRPEVREEQARAALGSIVLIQPPSLVALTLMAIAIAAAAFAYLFLAEHARKAPLAGVLVPASGTLRVVAPHAGIVRARRVREGDRVAPGEAMLALADARATADDGAVARVLLDQAGQRLADARRSREATREAAEGEQRALAGRIAGLVAERDQLDREIASLAAREELAQRSLARVDALARRGFVSTAQRERQEEEALDQRARRHALERSRLSLRREQAGLEHALAEARARARAQQAALDAQLAQLAQEQVERRAQAQAIVTAPVGGVVAALLAEPGQLVAGGTTLATLLPEGSPLEAHLYAPSGAVGFIRPGQEVLLRYPAFPYQKFGSHRARVLAVSRSALTPAELGFVPADGAREPVYRVKVALASQTVAAYGRAEPLQAGMAVQADVLLDRRRLVEWVFEPLLSLAGRT